MYVYLQRENGSHPRSGGVSHGVDGDVDVVRLYHTTPHQGHTLLIRPEYRFGPDQTASGRKQNRGVMLLNHLAFEQRLR